jgi:hypothetical protein
VSNLSHLTKQKVFSTFFINKDLSGLYFCLENEKQLSAEQNDFLFQTENPISITS